MIKIIQTSEELLSSLSVLQTDWKDEFASLVIKLLEEIPEDSEIEQKRLIELLDADFEAASTIFRLFLEMSKDEYIVNLKTIFAKELSTGKSGFVRDKEKYTSELDHLLIRQKISNSINKEYTWKDIIIERLKAGRGSAIKGQKRGRGRALEDFVE